MKEGESERKRYSVKAREVERTSEHRVKWISTLSIVTKQIICLFMG